MNSTGFILINKPAGPSSHHIIQKLRFITNIRTIGHSGTLDPFASGLLLVAINKKCTTQLSSLQKLNKTYKTSLQLGYISDSYDITGNIKPITNNYNLTKKQIQLTLEKFIGSQLQTPPIFSAKKINGQRAYQLALKQKPIKLPPNQIFIYYIKLIYFDSNKKEIKLEIKCSSGTYIRSLGHDIGLELGCGAYVSQLIRTKIGPFNLKNSTCINDLDQSNWHCHLFKKLPKIKTKTKVLIFGTFDCLHPGHINCISQAQKFGSELFIIIARDKNVLKIKHKLPLQNEITRLKKIKQSNLAPANNIMLGQLDFSRRYKILNKIKPDVIALGYDQQINLNQLKSKLNHYLIKTKIVRLKPFFPEKYKSSLINKT